MNKLTLTALTLFSTLTIGLSSANAALITYTDRASWEAALNSFSSENFSSLTSNINIGGSSSVVGSLTFSSNKSPADEAYLGSNSLNMRAFMAGDYVEVALPGLFNAFSFDYTQLDANGQPLGVTLNGVQIAALPNQLGNGSAFFGLINDTAANINSFQLNFAGGFGGMYARVNNVSWSSAAVPAPTAFWLLGSSLLGFMSLSKRRKV